MLHAVGKILYFLIWVMLFRMAKREIDDPEDDGSQPQPGGRSDRTPDAVAPKLQSRSD